MRSVTPAPEGMERSSDLKSLPSFFLNHIVHKYHQALQSRLRSAGVSALQMRIILTLHAYGRLTVGELCNFAISEQPTMSRALDGLEAHGLVRREMSEGDNRLRLVSLTPEGATIHARIHPVVISLNEAMVADLDTDERAALIDRLGGVLTNLGRL